MSSHAPPCHRRRPDGHRVAIFIQEYEAEAEAQIEAEAEAEEKSAAEAVLLPAKGLSCFATPAGIILCFHHPPIIMTVNTTATTTAIQ